MEQALSRFRVVALHGARTIDVRISDNRLILVGENGSGKSTVVNLIYYFLTRQWHRLREYAFTRIEATLGDHSLVVTPEQIDILRKHNVSQGRSLPAVFRRTLLRYSEEHHIEELLEDPAALSHMSHELGMSPRMAREMMFRYLDDGESLSPELHQTTQTLSRLFTDQVLYLPTYRRIEQDLKSIFRGVEVEGQLRQFKERISASRNNAPYVELVEFGMEDVERSMSASMAQLKDTVRTGLNSLTGSYLRDVIRGVHTNVSTEKIEHIAPETLNSMFARIDEAVLPQADKRQLQSRVNAMRGKQWISDQDKVIAHFLSQLLDLHRSQQENEFAVREFVAVCNQYLVGKEVVYDSSSYDIYIRSHSPPRVLSQDDAPSDRLTLRMLSSGEKQIVSLFSHIYFSGKSSFYVVLDEPELSLSVPWQRRFLPDILATGKCNGLLAVTHSPFIWENSLEPHVRSIAEFVEETLVAD
jgi:predicted ATPase